jgi:hypothetical protein
MGRQCPTMADHVIGYALLGAWHCWEFGNVVEDVYVAVLDDQF